MPPLVLYKLHVENASVTAACVISICLRVVLNFVSFEPECKADCAATAERGSTARTAAPRLEEAPQQWR